MLPTPNLQTIAQQTQELAKNSKDQRLGLVFQTVSMVSMAVLGVGAAVHLLREMLRHPHHHHTDHNASHADKHHNRHHSEGELGTENDKGSMTRHAHRRSTGDRGRH
jgi:hypothetical protein